MRRFFAGPARFALCVLLIAAVMVGAAAFAAYARFGSVSDGLKYLRGEHFYVSETVKDLGAVEPG